MKTNFNHRHRSGNGIIFFALLLILAGTIYAMLDTRIISPVYRPVIFSWQMLLILIGIYQFFTRNIIFGLILAGVGIGFLLPVVNQVFPEFHFTLYWPYILIAVGIVIIVKHLFFNQKRDYCASVSTAGFDAVTAKETVKPEKTCVSSEHTNGDKIEKNVAFSSSEQIVFSRDFQGGEVNVAFGELKLDLRKAKLSEVNYLEANVCFGNIEIYVPAEWKINLKSETFFGNIQNDGNLPQQDTDSSLPILNLKGAAFLGNVEIKW
ncbi:MAG: cell wall-active antibiotics response protein [Prevotella sp.]|nr:cell wall-active antibiotics response protein [Prevotella sp.]